MRGKGVQIVRGFCVSGITPAYAGKSDFFTLHSRRVKDHPRLCGEKPFRRKYENFHVGSPPPMRGKVPDAFSQGLYTRITPAYAGKSFRCRVRHLQDQDHPRLCGEK